MGTLSIIGLIVVMVLMHFLMHREGYGGHDQHTGHFPQGNSLKQKNNEDQHQ